MTYWWQKPIKIKCRWEIEGLLDKKKTTSKPRISTHEENDVLLKHIQANPFKVALNAIEPMNIPKSRPIGRLKTYTLKLCCCKEISSKLWT